MSQEDMMQLGKQYTVELTINGLVIVDEKGETLNPYHVDHLLKIWNSSRQSWVYVCYGYSSKIKNYCYKIGFTTDVDRRMQQLRFDLVYRIRGELGSAMITERHLQGYFMEKGKWLGGEYFDLSDEDIKQIKSLQSFRDIRTLPTQISWDYIAEWNRELVAAFKQDYIKGTTYFQWYEARKARKPEVNLPSFLASRISDERS